MNRRLNLHAILFAALLLAALLGGCRGGERAATDGVPAAPEGGGPASDNSLVLYSGRSETLIGPLLERFSRETGIRVQARYGETAEMAATLLEEGRRTPADLFLAQDAAALGAVADGGLARALPDDILSRVPPRFAAADGSWIGVSGRARTIVYNTSRVRPDQLPQSLDDIPRKAPAGRWGLAPLNASFQSHMAVVRAIDGADALDRLLKGLVDARPRRYAKNGAIVEAVASGEIDWGLVNHYYAWEAKKERPELPVENYFMPRGDASSFVNVAGVALVDDDPDAVALIRFLLSDEAQRYFATETFEYPLVRGIDPPVALQPLDELRTPSIDFARVSEALPETLLKINQHGLSRN